MTLKFRNYLILTPFAIFHQIFEKIRLKHWNSRWLLHFPGVTTILEKTRILSNFVIPNNFLIGKKIIHRAKFCTKSRQVLNIRHLRILLWSLKCCIFFSEKVTKINIRYLTLFCFLLIISCRITKLFFHGQTFRQKTKDEKYK